MARALKRGAWRLRGIGREAAGAWRITADLGSFGRYFADLLLYRLLRFGDLPGSGRERRIHLHDGIVLRYRLNRGDIQTVREVWIKETYRPPVELGHVDTILDLGANIGLAGVYLAKRLGCTWLLAVEPLASNARLARANLSANGVPGEVVEAALGAHDGVTRFQAARDFNVGRVDARGVEVPMQSVGSLLDRLPGGVTVDLLKMDIEGSEQAVLEQDRSWLERVGCLMIEFHPERVDMPRLIGLIGAEGFRYIPAGTVLPDSADTFVRGDAGEGSGVGAGPGLRSLLPVRASRTMSGRGRKGQER